MCWMPIGNGPIDNVYIKIYSDFNYEDTIEILEYGNYEGTCHVNDGYIEMYPNGKLNKDNYMKILAKFHKGTFNTNNNLNYNFEYYYNME